MNDDLNSSPLPGLLRPVTMLTGCIGVVALLLLPVAWNKAASNGLAGLAIAAAVCLAAGVVAELLAFLLRRTVQPLGVMLLGMTIRMVPPLAICMYLALQGARGREHLAFIVYLLVFYLATLAVETWFNVKRAARVNSSLHSAVS